jgi:hypothetical protein
MQAGVRTGPMIGGLIEERFGVRYHDRLWLANHRHRIERDARSRSERSRVCSLSHLHNVVAKELKR